MGVTGLLPMLAPAQEATTLEKYRGKTLAIDAYGWLHRGIISCAQELCTNKPTRRYVTLIMKKVDLLRYYGVEPYFVFDGAALPTKAETNKERRIKREQAQAKADAYINAGNNKAAWKEFMKAAGVTCQMAKTVMVELDTLGIEYVVAPYEADPQMVYLERIGIVDGILLEDSDLLVFGANLLITKLKDNGTCVEVNRQRIAKTVPMLGLFTSSQWRYMAMLSGCDYTKGIDRVGMATAVKLVYRYPNIDRLLQALRAEGKVIPPTFAEEMKLADLAFQFQKVYHPQRRALETLNPYPEDMDVEAMFEDLERCCGETRDHAHYQKACTGKIHPTTGEPLLTREQSLLSVPMSNSQQPQQQKSQQSTLSFSQRLLVTVSSTTTTTSSTTTKLVLDYFGRSQEQKKSKTTTSSLSQLLASQPVPVLAPPKKPLPTSQRLRRMLGRDAPQQLSPFFSKLMSKSEVKVKVLAMVEDDSGEVDEVVTDVDEAPATQETPETMESFLSLATPTTSTVSQTLWMTSSMTAPVPHPATVSLESLCQEYASLEQEITEVEVDMDIDDTPNCTIVESLPLKPPPVTLSPTKHDLSESDSEAISNIAETSSSSSPERLQLFSYLRDRFLSTKLDDVAIPLTPQSQPRRKRAPLAPKTLNFAANSNNVPPVTTKSKTDKNSTRKVSGSAPLTVPVSEPMAAPMAATQPKRSLADFAYKRPRIAK